MILCGNVFMDELQNTFFLCCVLCKKKSRRYTDFTSHIKTKHKDLNKKEATPPKHVAKKIKNEDSDDDYGHGETDEAKPEVEIKDEMDVDALEQFADDIKYDVQEIEPFIDPILAMEEAERNSADATDLFEAQDSDVKDEDYALDEPDNDDSEDEDYRDEDDNDADSDFEANELPISTDKFTPTFYRKKRFVNEFIELYKSQPVLWNITDPLFENAKAQKEAQEAIINGMQKFNIFLKPTALKSAINRIHKYCSIIKSDMDNGDSKKITSVAKGYYEKCDFLKDMLAIKEQPEGDKQNKPLTLKQWDDNTSKFIDAYAKFRLLYDGEHPLYGNFEEIQKAHRDFTNALLNDHKIDIKENLATAIDQLHCWYYEAKQRKGKQLSKLNKDEEEYLKKCYFLPEKRLKTKFFCHVCKKNFNMEHNLKGHLFRCHQIGELPFQCDQCGKKFEMKSTLQTHIQRMHVSRKYPCGFCGKLFAIKSELKVHNMVHTAEKPHVCELCGKAFRIKTQLRYHVTAIHTKIRAYKCTMCPKDFLKKRDLTDHIKTHLNIRDKICETCGKGFSNSHSLIRHRQIHSEVKRYACKLCDAKFHQFVGLNGHMKRTHNIKPLTLDQWDDSTCNFIEIFAKFPLLYDKKQPSYGKLKDKQNAMLDIQSILLSEHNINFSEEMISSAVDQLKSWYYKIKRRKSKPTKCQEKYLKMCKFIPGKKIKEKILCSICEKVFYTEHNLKYHLTKDHKIGDFSFQCEICGKKLVSKTALQYHNLRVHDEKKYPCEFCGKLYAIPAELKVHIRVHTAEKPHVCELCGKCFRLRNLLGLHVTRMHTKIRAFKCTICPKDFLKNTDLRDHMKTHLNIRDKICETCGKGFTNCHSLIRHRQIHSEVKKFACKLCDAKFHQFVGLNGHMKRTHNIVRKDSHN